MKTGFDPGILHTELEKLGLHLVDNLAPVDIERLYFQNRLDDYHAFEHFYFARAIV